MRGSIFFPLWPRRFSDTCLDIIVPILNREICRKQSPDDSGLRCHSGCSVLLPKQLHFRPGGGQLQHSQPCCALPAIQQQQASLTRVGVVLAGKRCHLPPAPHPHRPCVQACTTAERVPARNNTQAADNVTSFHVPPHYLRYAHAPGCVGTCAPGSLAGGHQAPRDARLLPWATAHWLVCVGVCPPAARAPE